MNHWEFCYKTWYSYSSTQYENIGVKTDTMTSLAPVITSSMTMDMGFLGI